MTFAALFVSKKRDKKKSYFIVLFVSEKYDKKASLSIRYATIGRIRYPHRPQSGREKSVIGFTGRYSPFSLS